MERSHQRKLSPVSHETRLPLLSFLVCPQSQILGFATQMGSNVYTVLTFLAAAQFQDHQKQKRSSSPTMH